MRLFVAVDIPDNISEKIEKINLDSFEGKKVEKENYHINLLFLGETEDTEKIIKNLDEIKFKKFNVTLNGFSAFPNLNVVRVLLVKAESKELINLQKQISEKLDAKGERDYIPHLTLMRVKETKEEYKTFFNKTFKEQFEAENFRLYKSVLTREGPKYEILKTFKAE